MTLEQPSSLYRAALSLAAHFAWHHKWLWIFGFFAAVLNSSGAFDIVFRLLEDLTAPVLSISSLADAFLPGLSTFLVIIPALEQAPGGSFFATALVALFLTSLLVLIVWLSIKSQRILVSGAHKHLTRSGNDTGPFTLPEVRALSALDRKSFGALLVANLIGKLMILISTLIGALPLLYFTTENALSRTVLSVFSYTTFIVLAFIAGLLTTLAVINIILKKSALRSAFSDAWELFRNHWLIMLETSLFLFLILVIIAGFIGIIIQLMIVPLTFYLLASGFFVSAAAYAFFHFLFFFLTIVLVLAGIGYLVTFQFSCWTLLVLRLSLHAHGHKSATHRYIFHPLRAWFNRKT